MKSGRKTHVIFTGAWSSGAHVNRGAEFEQETRQDLRKEIKGRTSFKVPTKKYDFKGL